MGDYGGSAHRNASSTSNPRDLLPHSQYLQERLLERRTRNTRPKRSRHTDFGPDTGRDDDIFLQEAEDGGQHVNGRLFETPPLASGRHTRQSSDAGTTASERRRRQLGARELDEQMDRLTKQNFALKLELDHRREHTAKLNERLDAMLAQVERADKVEQEHAELLHINSQLVAELEKRDKAVEEAMDIICDLEERISDMEDTRSVSRPTTAHADSGYAGTETHDQPTHSSSPQQSKEPRTPAAKPRQPPAAASAATRHLVSVVNDDTLTRNRREPSFISTKKPSTQALRNVYLQTGKELQAIKSFNSLLSHREGRAEDDEAVLNSPRLSVLSDSSFRSMYSPMNATSTKRYAQADSDDGSDEGLEAAKAHASHFRQDSISRVSQWIAERESEDETPSKSSRTSPPLAEDASPRRTLPPSALQRPSGQSRFQSLNDALSTARPQDLQPRTMPETSRSQSYQGNAERQLAKQNPKTPTMGGPMFGTPLLPPTPDSASTRMLRTSRSSIADDRSLLDVTPAAIQGYDTLEPSLRTTPKQMRSSVEINEAYNTYARHQRAQPGRRYRSHPLDADGSSSSESSDEDDETVQSGNVGGFMNYYDGYPDGSSIVAGTPSRLLKPSKPPPTEMFSSGNNVSPPRTSKPQPPGRRVSSTDTITNPQRPAPNRAETSPTVFTTIGRFVTGGPKSPIETVASPKSAYSGSSSNGTIVQVQEMRHHSMSPEVTRSRSRSNAQITSPTRARATASPAPTCQTFGQKTQKLFRRMSNSHETRRDRDPSPLPTLTRTPSSAYVNELPRARRRPSNSQFDSTPRASASQAQRPPSQANQSPRPATGAQEPQRPDMHARRGTEPASLARPPTATANERSTGEPKERKNPFRRSNSTKKPDEPPTRKGSISNGAENGNHAGRRASLRDAVGTVSRRPWR